MMNPIVDSQPKECPLEDSKCVKYGSSILLRRDAIKRMKKMIDVESFFLVMLNSFFLVMLKGDRENKMYGSMLRLVLASNWVDKTGRPITAFQKMLTATKILFQSPITFSFFFFPITSYVTQNQKKNYSYKDHSNPLLRGFHFCSTLSFFYQVLYVTSNTSI